MPLQNEVDFFDLFISKELLQLISKETNRYYNNQLNFHSEKDKGWYSSEWYETNADELKIFFALILLMGHIEKDCLKDYWSTDELIATPIFGKSMPRDRFLQILGALHFADNSTKPKNDENYDRLWKLRDVFNLINDSFKKYYSPTEELSIDEVIVNLKAE
ncbi:piggyBac transposable element-derived protein 4-like [Parasteatoda tepidariorum]|uniref:piggyBac transposable element-derived protein 4-like n=1 Tax=Parasteatoda tepidariorum TaxID=114398 RepID=UPI001C720A6D|nr:piggyBac transposable element-derived protein 4-like [Parasteatoda tepidariorum]